MKYVIGLTMGDPAGIGPEIILKAAARLARSPDVRLVVFGDQGLLSYVQRRVVRKKAFPRVQVIDFHNVSLKRFKFGRPTASLGNASGDYIAAAVRAAQSGFIDAIVTAPINKLSFQRGGWGKQYVGHTEMLAQMTGSKRTALMLVHGVLRAIHATSHIPLKDVPSSLNGKRVFETIALAALGLKQLGLQSPRIAVCGLNPHAGDGGVLGDEEERFILPAIQKAHSSGFHVKGPFSADAVWPMVLSQKFDVGVAMYHDQGQIPVKLLCFQARAGRKAVVHGVNVTIGLPIIRTSVAHGTAYEIAGKGTASEQSLLDAIQLATQMAKKRRK